MCVYIYIYMCVCVCVCVCVFMAQQPLLTKGLFILEAPRSHLDTTHSVGLLWTSDPDTSTWQHATLGKDRQPCSQRDSKPQSQQTHALDLAATGIGSNIYIYVCVCVCVCVCVWTARLIHEFCVILTISNDYFVKAINQLFFTFETKYYFLRCKNLGCSLL